jgi:hypothetical protein
MSCSAQQQPRNRIGVRRILPRGHLPGHFTSVVVLPRGPREVMSDAFSGSVEQLRFRPFEDPGKLLIATRLAHINLRSSRMSPQNHFFRRGCCQFVGNVRPCDLRPTSKEKKKHHRSELKSADHTGSLTRNSPRLFVCDAGKDATILGVPKLTRPRGALWVRIFVHRPPEKTQIAIPASEGPQADRGEKERLKDPFSSGSMDVAAMTVRTANRHENTSSICRYSPRSRTAGRSDSPGTAIAPTMETAKG